MTLRLRASDLWAGLALMALAAAYYGAATGINRSLLSDEIGAAGVPKVLAVMLGFAGALLAARSQWTPSKASPRLTARAVGILLIIAAYILVLPVAGYPFTIFALVGGVALLAGAPPTPGLVLIATAAGLGFWLIFARLLGVSMPPGIFSGWM